MTAAHRVLKQLYIGIAMFFVIFAILGLIFMRPVWIFELSLLAGCLAGCFMAYNMYDVLDRALDLEARKAKGFVTVRSFLRLGICLVLMAIAVKISWVSFTGVTIGLLGLKVSAFFNPLVRRLMGDVTEAAENVNDIMPESYTDAGESRTEDDYEDDDYEDDFVKKHFQKYLKQKDRYM